MVHQEEVNPIEENQGDYYDEDIGYVDVETEDQQTDVETIETEDAAEQPGEMQDLCGDFGDSTTAMAHGAGVYRQFGVSIVS